MTINKEIIELKIDSLTYEGAGIGKHEGKAVFVPDTVDGDIAKVEIISSKKNFSKGKLLEVTNPSEHRTKPFCALANACGGCQWQHITYEHQLESKRKIVKETVSKISGINIPVNEVIPSPKIKEYRCKIQLPVSQTKVSKRILSGYYKKGTHELINIKYCPIQPAIINEITEFLKIKAQELGLSGYNERKHKGLIRHFVFRYSEYEKNILLIFVINAKQVPQKLIELANEISKNFDCITGVQANFNTSKTNVIIGQNSQAIIGKDYIIENLKGKNFKISTGSFFQVNPSSAINIFNTVKNIIEDRVNKPKILDAYSGVGSFSIWLSDIASEVIAVEEYPQAVKDAKENIKLNNVENIKLKEGDAQHILEEFAEKNEKFDVIIIDPPRKGCSPKAIEALTKLTNSYIIYVSCNPATLARDIKILKESGFNPENIQPVDMFCHSYHIESIVVLKKCNN